MREEAPRVAAEAKQQTEALQREAREREVAQRYEKQQKEEAARLVAEAQRKAAILRDEQRSKEVALRQAEETEKIRDLEYLQSLDPTKFEQLVLEAFRKIGWDAKGTPASGDRGVDGWLKRNNEVFILQCKRFGNKKVGGPALRDLLGTVVRENATGGFLITTSSFTAEALSWAKGEKRLHLYDGEITLKFIREAFPDGTLVPKEFVASKEPRSVSGTSRTPRGDLSICPECGKRTRRVKGKRGRYKSFIGCSGYPVCQWADYKSSPG